jgi:hypothetical protein
VICDGYKGFEWIATCDQKISSCSLSVMCATCLYQLESPSGLTVDIVSRLSQQIKVICRDLLLINGIDLVKIDAFLMARIGTVVVVCCTNIIVSVEIILR